MGWLTPPPQLLTSCEARPPSVSSKNLGSRGSRRRGSQAQAPSPQRGRIRRHGATPACHQATKHRRPPSELGAGLPTQRMPSASEEPPRAARGHAGTVTGGPRCPASPSDGQLRKSLFLRLDASESGGCGCLHFLLQMPPPPRSRPHLLWGKLAASPLGPQRCLWHCNSAELWCLEIAHLTWFASFLKMRILSLVLSAPGTLSILSTCLRNESKNKQAQSFQM